MEDLNRVKCKVKLSKQLFPKGKINNGEYGILSVSVVEVLQGEPDISKWGTITITGNMCEIEYNEIYTIIADEIIDDKYGKQYKLVYIGRDVKLDSIESQKIFFQKILTMKQVENLFNAFENPLKIIETEDVERLCTVNGIGAKTALNIIEKYNNTKDYSSAYVFLDSYGLTNNMINKLIESYGSPEVVISKIQENPYLIADDVDGIGWSKADEIALNGGYEQYAVNRIKAYIEYYLKAQAMEGNSYVDIDDMLECIEDNIGYEIPEENLNLAFKEMAESKMWYNKDKTKLGLKKYYYLEKNIATELLRLKNATNNFKYNNWLNDIKDQEEDQGWNYTDEQKEAIKTILENNVVLLSGSAGTGKTSTVAGVLSALKKYSFSQTALSGKASVNLTDVTGEEGFTIHRLLGYNPSKGFTYNNKNQLDTDIVILDELSMVDGNLFFKLIQSIKSGSKLIMLGDTGQLESIGVANIMQDIIDSGVIPHATLTQIHRQAAKSAIITESMKIRNHEQITSSKFTGVETRGEIKDLVLDIYDSKNETFNKIIEYTKEILKNITNIMDFQILVPMKSRGESCTYKINLEVQGIINKKQRGLIKKQKFINLLEGSKTPYSLYEGDKVINTKNNYKTVNVRGEVTPIFNGNLGIIKEVDENNRTLIIDFENIGEVIVKGSHLNSIELGYAITVHKSQGSGFKFIICGIDYSHYSLLNKEMVYTMLTRAKKKCILCSQNKALHYAISRSNVKSKQTFLKQMLQEGNSLE
ncbi:AAA family ATPase [Clostridium perfringens]|uniref:AAA family ATPase n=1 Tax=Clostridium perfringens TaxID=1502 RepID=UPI0023402DB3|nr:AAA family ATPase [Clostridium perfringens]MDC4245686.1 ATP-dependent RecD-like DNA helicase [Clostridium perfringens]